jgi:pimeloyl-ACP methyl ester carboxylesterase
MGGSSESKDSSLRRVHADIILSASPGIRHAIIRLPHAPSLAQSVHSEFKMVRSPLFLLLAIILSAVTTPVFAQHEPSVEIVAGYVFPVTTPHGTAQMPFDVSLDWNLPQPQVIRAVVIFHGKGRDVDGYYRSARRAAELAGGDAAATSIVVAPQFLNDEDARAHGLPANVLRWHQGTWEAGAEASGPVPLSAYDVIDAIVAHLSDRRLFPNLKTIVLAGHSGGGQAMQRYAVAGHAEHIAGSAIHIRYIVANPSSYLYFSDDRPKFDGQTFRFENANGNKCRDFNHWKFGPLEVHEEYVQQSASAGWQALEDAFAQKDVLYLLGTADVDPHEKDLDVSCAGEMEGPSRFLRGQAYYSWLHSRHPANWNQRMWFVPGVAHSAGKMFTSDCGVAALFERASCPDH